MSFRVIFDSEAMLEFQEAAEWYESRCSRLGVRFISQVDKVISAISLQPFQFSKVGQRCRKARVRGWPYTIYFIPNEVHAEVKIIAVWHGARNPVKLRRRMK